MTDLLYTSHEYLVEHAYLVARGVRPLALAGHCKAAPGLMTAVFERLTSAAAPGAQPFIIEREDGIADWGYAREDWAIDLYRWAQSDAVPEVHRHRIIGLLLGYSAAAIRSHGEGRGGTG